MILTHKSTTNWVPSQPRKRHTQEESPAPDSDFSNWRNLSHQRRNNRHECTGGESVQHAENDDGSVACGRKPERKNNDGGECCGYNHDVESSDMIGNDSGEDSAEDTGCVQDW